MRVLKACVWVGVECVVMVVGVGRVGMVVVGEDVGEGVGESMKMGAKLRVEDEDEDISVKGRVEGEARVRTKGRCRYEVGGEMERERVE